MTTASALRLTAHDYGIKAATGLRAPSSTMDLEVYDRPHPSPAMERALQRIETEIPARLREIAARPADRCYGDFAALTETEATDQKEAA